eukprot:scaffold26.g3322.t1
MVLVLAIGDLHIPHRASDLPAKFRALLVPGKIHHVICTGNLCTESVYEYLRSVCSDVHVVQGDFDESTRWPDSEVLEVGAFRIGAVHGHQVVPWGDADALAILQRRLDCDILVTGHTHQFKAYRQGDRFVINPGSATGAFTFSSSGGAGGGDAGPSSSVSLQQPQQQPVPSFVLMDIDGTKCTVYVYELRGEEVKVDKLEFSKSGTATL